MRKNQWYHELIILCQESEETVDTYANKFIKLAERVGLTDVVQKKRMLLMGFNLHMLHLFMLRTLKTSMQPLKQQDE